MVNITAIKPEIIDKLQAVKKEQIEATQKKEKEAKDKKAAEDKKNKTTVSTAVSGGVTTSSGSSMSTPLPATLTSVDTSGGQVATETERLQNELRNLTRNARALASNVEVCLTIIMFLMFHNFNVKLAWEICYIPACILVPFLW